MISDNLKAISTRYPNIRWEGKTRNDVGDGWVPLVEETMKKLSLLLGDNVLEIGQVKEKYGALTIYATSTTPRISSEISKIICEAGDAAMTICERCGKPGTRTEVNGVWKTSCDACLQLP